MTLVTAAFSQTFTTFDAPNSISVRPTAINTASQITGLYSDATGSHGFVRQADGTFTSFDAPNIDTFGVQLIGVTSINAAGRITGYMFLLNLEDYASFIREPDGTFTTFREPAECFPSSRAMTSSLVANIEGIAASAINNGGQITGICGEFPPFDQSFLRRANGTFTAFKVAVDGPSITRAQAINSRGQITGNYFDHGTFQGFLRERNGRIRTFGTPFSDVSPTAINAGGQITGIADGHGFLRRPNGTMATFDVPGATSTHPTSMNAKGEITGYYLDASFAPHGFLRERNGAIGTFDVPGAGSTYASAINSSGDVTGWYSDVSGVHGFIRRAER